jgi:hypothetical protein
VQTGPVLALLPVPDHGCVLAWESCKSFLTPPIRRQLVQWFAQ